MLLARLSMPFSAATDAENNNACSLYTTKVNMSLFPVIVVFGLSFPPDIFRIAFITGDFLAGAPGTCANRYLRLCLASGVVQHRALLLLVLFDIATGSFEASENT